MKRRHGLLALLWGFFALTASLSAQTVQIRTAPRPQGNYEFFQPQRAYNTMLLSRLPKGWTVPASRYVLWQGPVLANKTEAMKLFTNGGVTASMIPDATNPLSLPSARRGNFPGGHGTHVLAGQLAQEVGSGDARYQSLLDYATPPYYVDENVAAYQLLGQRSFASSIAANNNVPPAFWGTDLEDHDNKPGLSGAREHFPIYVYQGARQKINELGLSTKLFTYGTASLSRITNHTNNRQDADIAMRLAPIEWQGSDGLFSVTDPKTQVFRDGAFVGGDKYLRMTWDNATLWQKNGDGSLKLDGNNLPIYHVGKRTISNYGQTSETYTHEAQAFNDMWYSELDKIIIEWRWHCNTPVSGYTGNFVNMPIPLGTIDIRPGLEKVKKLSFIRDNTEMLQIWNPDIGAFDPWYSTPELGIEAANSRALNADALEFTVLMRTMLNDMLYVFGNPGNYADWVNGQANQHAGDFRGTGGQNNYAIKQRFGQFETILNASRRGRNFPELFKVMDANKARFVIPWRPVVRGNTVDYAEHQSNKPLVFGVKEDGGRRFWIAAAFPAQDVNNPAMERNLTWWLDDGAGKVSSSYFFTLKNRATAFEQILLPAGWENATAEMFRFKFTGLSGTAFYRTGNYNVAVSGTPAVPAAATGGLINYTLPGTIVDNTQGGGATTLRLISDKIYLADVGEETVEVAACFMGTSSTTIPALTEAILIEQKPGETAEQVRVAGAASSERTRHLKGSYTRLRVRNRYDLRNRRYLVAALPLQDKGPNGTLLPGDEATYRNRVASGCNAIQAVVFWHHIEPTTPGQYDWRQVDHLVALAKELNVPFGIRFQADRETGDGRNSDAFIPAGEAQCRQDGKVTDKGFAWHPSPSSIYSDNGNVSVVGRMETALKALLNHVRSLPGGDQLIEIGVTLSGTYECEYEYEDRDAANNNELYAELVDFSSAAKRHYRQYLLEKYGNLTSINQALGTSFGSVNAIVPADFGPTRGVVFPDRSTAYKLSFFEFREWALRSMVNRFAAAVYAIDPGVPYLYETGNLQDPLSILRGTEGLVNGSLLIDGLKNNNGPYDDFDYPIGFTAALARGTNRWAADEAFLAQKYTESEIAFQCKEFFARGGNFITLYGYRVPFANYNPDNREQERQQMDRVIKNITDAYPLTALVPRGYDKVFDISTSRLRTDTYANGNPSIRTEYQNLTESKTKRVRVRVRQP